MKRFYSLLRRVYWSAYLAWHVIGQARYPFRSPQRMRRDADRNTRRMVAYAYRWVPYYRETLDGLGLTPRDFGTVDDLHQLPLISVADLQAAPERFHSTQYAPEDLHITHSSGSTGRPHEVWHSLAYLYASVAHSERETSIHRRLIGKGRRLKAMGLRSPMNNASPRDLVRANALYPSKANMWRSAAETRARVDDHPEKIIAALNARQPDLFYAYGSTMARLFTYAHRHGLAFYRPTVVRYAADGLPQAVRELLTDEYGLHVFSAYQSIEMSKMGFECEVHRGYHNNADLYPIRIVDEQGADCPPGVVGEVVASNLVNRATVLLNYRHGDLAAWQAEPCPCGRKLPLLSYIYGRQVDLLYGTDGQPLDHMCLSVPLVSQVGVWEFQITQHALDQISINLSLAPGVDAAATERELRARMEPALGPAMRLTFTFDQEMVRTGAAKLRSIISKVPTPSSETLANVHGHAG